MEEFNLEKYVRILENQSTFEEGSFIDNLISARLDSILSLEKRETIADDILIFYKNSIDPNKVKYLRETDRYLITYVYEYLQEIFDKEIYDRIIFKTII